MQTKQKITQEQIGAQHIEIVNALLQALFSINSILLQFLTNNPQLARPLTPPAASVALMAEDKSTTSGDTCASVDGYYNTTLLQVELVRLPSRSFDTSNCSYDLIRNVMLVLLKLLLVGGFNPFEKNNQIASFSQVGVKIKNI